MVLTPNFMLGVLSFLIASFRFKCEEQGLRVHGESISPEFHETAIVMTILCKAKLEIPIEPIGYISFQRWAEMLARAEWQG